MHNLTITTSTQIPFLPKCHFYPFIPISFHNPISITHKSFSIFTCKVSTNKPLPTLSNANSNSKHEKGREKVGKEIDISTLGNLCVDIVLNVAQLPPEKFDDRKAYMQALSKSPPPKKYWEAGGNCNMAIAAARLGLHCSTIGHVGDEIYGRFLLDVLHEEGINMVGMCDDNDVDMSSVAYETLLCWVLVDPLQRHGFCSRADFSKNPAYCWITKLSSGVKTAIKKSKVMFCNGYGFDELSPGLITSAVEYAVEVGTAVFFDPGPKGKSLSKGTPEEQKAFDKLIRMADVLLLTSEEAESLTGIDNPVLAGKDLLRKGLRTKWVIIKMGATGSILITMSSISCAPAFKVDLMDTVGCGDSFVAAIAFAFIQNMPMIYALTIANAVGAATAMGSGAGRNVAKLQQVIELMKAANLNEDDIFWKELIKENFDAEEITLLSRMVVNGNKKMLNCVPLTKVVSEMLPKLESTQVAGILQT